MLCSSVAQERGASLPLVCAGWWSRLDCPWKGGPGKINTSGLAEVIEGGETFTAVSSRVVTGDCMGTLSVRVRHPNFMVQSWGEKSTFLEGIKEASSYIFSFWDVSSCPPAGELLVSKEAVWPHPKT